VSPEQLHARLAERVVLLDGATGTEFQRRGLPAGVCPELWAAQNPACVREIHVGYFEAGSDAVYSCTFGANRFKLAEYGIRPGSVSALNERLAGISRYVVPPGKLLVGDIGPTGHLVAPFGELPFEDAVEAFAEQVRGLVAAGVDLLVVETMMDIQEARAALIACRETCDLPVLVSMTYDESIHTLTGTVPEAATVILQSLGAFAVGCNWSTGPDAMRPVLERVRPVARVPLFAKPNAGLPILRQGKTLFDMDAETFGRKTSFLVEAGAGILGGCCGTGADHIRALSAQAYGLKTPAVGRPSQLHLSSPRKVVSPGPARPLTVIGERINPTGKKKLQQALRERDYTEVLLLASEQAAAGAQLLDVNAGMSGIDEIRVLPDLLQTLSVAVDSPLVLDSSSPEVLAAALREYPGRALVNSVSAERKKLHDLLPIATRYGAAILVLPLDDDGVPGTARERAERVRLIAREAELLGCLRHDLVVDGLVMTISSSSNAAQAALETVQWASQEFGVNTILGLSNVSFGLPARPWLNATFLAMAVARGLTMVIANPCESTFASVVRASDALQAADPGCLRYITHFSRPSDGLLVTPAGPAEACRQAVLQGHRERIGSLVREALDRGLSPYSLIEEQLIPALIDVGDRFERKEYFLPQLMLSAETVQKAFELLEPLLDEAGKTKIGKVVVATVQGDVHDIGKNIVALMLRNYGFDVIDLGKDVPTEEILRRVRQERAHIVGLSALMTTTMTEMEEIIDRARAERLQVKFMVGGAVVTEEYARQIGADAYARDAVGAAKAARSLMEQQAKQGSNSSSGESSGGNPPST